MILVRSHRFALVALLALALLGAGCGDDEGDEPQDGGQEPAAEEFELVNPGALTVGSDIPFPPFEQGRAPDYEGFDIDLAREIARRLELETRIQDTPFDTIFRDLAQGKFDAVASATTITEERERAVDFSDPYYAAEQALLVEAGGEIQAVDDLAGAIVGVQDGTTGADYVNDETEARAVRGYGEADDAYNALQAGQVNAVIIDLPAAQDAARQTEGLEVATAIETGEQYGIAFQEDADALREAANDALAELKRDGTYEEIYRQWFNRAPPQSILEATHQPS